MKIRSLFLLSILCLLLSFKSSVPGTSLPKGFVYVSDVIPNIKLDIRYLGNNNFVGKPIDGYVNNRCILTVEAAMALKEVEDALQKRGFCLQIYDGYRPQKAVDHFKRWARNINDTLMKSTFYPTVDKRDLFRLEYISSNSRHSSGSTVDLTIFSDRKMEVLDMGSVYDYFGERSWIDYQHITPEQKRNRQLLQNVMILYGFRPYPKEWWHFTLRGEPYRNQYFDFDVE